MASIRTTIHNAIVSRLQSINTANNYTNSVALVTKRALTREQVRDFPTLMVLAGPVAIEAANDSMELWKATGVYMVVGVARAKEDAELAGLLDEEAAGLIEDIEECLLTSAGELFDAPTAEIKMIQLQSEPVFLDYDNNYAEVQVLIAVTYYFGSNV